MASWVKLQLDLMTDGEIIIPPYITLASTFHVRIASDEILNEIFDFKITDSLGIEHSYPSSYPDSTEYIFEISLADYPIGETIVSATIRDSVGNIKALLPQSFKIFEGAVTDISLIDLKLHDIALKTSSTFGLEILNRKSTDIIMSEFNLNEIELKNSKPILINIRTEGSN